MKVKTWTLAHILGPAYARLLTECAKLILLEAFAKSGTALMESDAIEIYCNNPHHIAAARLLCAAGLLNQNLYIDRVSVLDPIYGFFRITEEGKKIARKLTISQHAKKPRNAVSPSRARGLMPRAFFI